MKITRARHSVAFLEREYQPLRQVLREVRMRRALIILQELAKEDMDPDTPIGITNQVRFAPFGAPSAEDYREIDIKQ